MLTLLKFVVYVLIYSLWTNSDYKTQASYLRERLFTPLPPPLASLINPTISIVAGCFGRTYLLVDVLLNNILDRIGEYKNVNDLWN